jgi:CubicO group peptidase (beta-lactamase class C family)
MPDLSRTRAHLEEGLEKNLWTGYSLAVRQSHGEKQIAEGDVPDPGSAVPWFSAGKPITAVGALRLLESCPALGPNSLSTTFPELAGSHAGTLTLDQILTHQTGLRVAETDLRGTPEKILRFFAKLTPKDCKLAPNQAAYDPAGGWWLLGQWIQRHTGKPWADYLEKDLLQPAGLGELKFHGPAVPIRERRAGQWVQGEHGMGPGAGLVGPAGQLALFYEKLLAGDFLSSLSKEKMVRPTREGKLDATFGQIVDFGLGVMLHRSSHDPATVPYGFGSLAGQGAFGHGGARSSIAFADPTAGFTAAVFLNGRVPETEHQPRMRTVLDLLRSELA